LTEFARSQVSEREKETDGELEGVDESESDWRSALSTES